MKLCDLYQTLDSDGRKKLAAAANVDPGYLWQLATKWRGKRPSIDVINRLVAADRRLKLSDLMTEFDSAKAS